MVPIDVKQFGKCIGLLLALLSFLLTSLVSVVAQAQESEVVPYLERKAVKEYIDTLVETHKFKRKFLRNLFAQAEHKGRIVELMNRQPEGTLTWGEYRNIFLDEPRISNGANWFICHKNLLRSLEEKYEVDSYVVTAIIGAETRYGKIQGGYRVVDSLMTLAFDYPRRAKYFQKELTEFLLMARDNDFDPLELKGSYSGAMGATQFMPSSYRAYAVDHNKDGKTNLWSDAEDAAASVYAYLDRFGWEFGKPAVLKAKMRARHNSIRKPQAGDEVAALGWQTEEDYDLTSEKQVWPLVLIRDEKVEFWMGLKNFRVITRYNNSTLYAMAISSLATEIQTEVSKRLEQDTCGQLGKKTIKLVTK